MRAIYLTVTFFAAAVALISAVAKLRHDPKVIKVIHKTVGVPMSYIPALAACEIAGALGLIAGIVWPALGVAAGLALVIYFVGAVVAHLRVGDFGGTGPAAFVLGLAIAALVSRILTM